MWSDNETERDFLNFSGIAGTVGEVIVQAGERPISIGVSGAWGAGKSSMIKLIRSSLEKRTEKEGVKFIIVEFNAWLYQGYDDARAALLEVIANALAEEATKQKIGMNKVEDFLSRINWLRAAKLTAWPAIAMALGLPPVGLAGETYQLVGQIAGGQVTKDAVKQAQNVAEKAATETVGLMRTTSNEDCLCQKDHDAIASADADLPVVLFGPMDENTQASVSVAVRRFPHNASKVDYGNF